jgi:hypothetical protein
MKRKKAPGIAVSVFSIVFYIAIGWASAKWPLWNGWSPFLWIFFLIFMFALSARLLALGEPRLFVRVAKTFLYSVILCAIAEAYGTYLAFTAPAELEGPEFGLFFLQMYFTFPVILLSMMFALMEFSPDFEEEIST